MVKLGNAGGAWQLAEARCSSLGFCRQLLPCCCSSAAAAARGGDSPEPLRVGPGPTRSGGGGAASAARGRVAAGSAGSARQGGPRQVTLGRVGLYHDILVNRARAY
jgi:hypothetical protein